MVGDRIKDMLRASILQYYFVSFYIPFCGEQFLTDRKLSGLVKVQEEKKSRQKR
jgi:hypothetical protein